MRCVAPLNAQSNNGMHPTAKGAALIENLCVSALRARRVMPGVMLLRILYLDSKRSL